MRIRRGFKTIKAAMRRNEVEVLAHLRSGGELRLWSLGSWGHALDRLEAGGMVRFRNGGYIAIKGARPVTGAVR